MHRLFDLTILGAMLLLGGASIASAQESDIEAQLKQRAANFNEKLPARVDGSTIWEKAVAGPGKRFTHVYKMTDLVGDSEQKRTTFAKSMRPKAVTVYCTNMKSLADNGVPISLQYMGSDDKLIADIVVTPEDCH